MSGRKKTVSSYWSEQTPVGEDWVKEWKFRTTPAAHSKVSGGWASKGKKRNAVESGEQYTKRRVAEESSKRTWMTDAADIAHGIGEGVLALHPYTAIPYFGAKVGQDVLNGNVSWNTALNASVPLFHLSPQVGAGIQATKNIVNNVNKYGDPAFQVVKDVAKQSGYSPNWRNYKFLGDKRFYSDLDNAGVNTLLYERSIGNYPLTFTERRNYVIGLKNDIQKGIDYAKQEAVNNVRIPIKKEIVVSPENRMFDLSKVNSYSDIQMQTPHFGTLKATREYGQTPWEGNYGAFQSKKGLFFPFRNKPNTLRTHSMFQDVGERINTGAHEARHTIQSYFNTPLTEFRSEMPGTYKRFTYKDLPLDLKRKVNSFINDAQTAGEWAGSLSEMDAELTGWSAQYGLPRYSQMSPYQKAKIYDLFQKRFGGATDYSQYNNVYGILNTKDALSNPNYLEKYAAELDNSKIGQIIQGLEQFGYRKQGGILTINNGQT